MRKSFILHKDSLGILSKLDDIQAGKLFKAIAEYCESGEINCDFQTELLLFPFQKQFDRDTESYQKTLERNRINGSKGGRPKTQDNPNKPTGLSGINNKPKKADSVSKSVSDSDSKNDSDNDKPKKNSRFTPPTISEVKEYCDSRKNSVDPIKFFNFYEASGWHRNKTKIKNWKACVITWEGNDNSKPKSKHDISNQNYKSGSF